jgi:hypothetical protein
MGREECEKHLKIPSLKEAGYSEEVHLRFAEKSKYAADLLKRGFMMFI